MVVCDLSPSVHHHFMRVCLRAATVQLLVLSIPVQQQLPCRTPARRQSKKTYNTPKSSLTNVAGMACRAASLDSGRTSEAANDAKRSRRIRTVDYSKPGADAPFSVPAMSGMAGRLAFPTLCWLPLLPIACCFSAYCFLPFCLLVAAYPACSWLPACLQPTACPPIECCLSSLCLAALLVFGLLPLYVCCQALLSKCRVYCGCVLPAPVCVQERLLAQCAKALCLSTQMHDSS